MRKKLKVFPKVVPIGRYVTHIRLVQAQAPRVTDVGVGTDVGVVIRVGVVTGVGMVTDMGVVSDVAVVIGVGVVADVGVGTDMGVGDPFFSVRQGILCECLGHCMYLLSNFETLKTRR